MNDSNERTVVLQRLTAVRGILLSSVLCVCLLPSVTLAFNLVSVQEAEESARYEATHQMSGQTRAFEPMGPQIEVLNPDLTGNANIPSPLAIRVKFQPTEGNEIIPESFHVYYGAFRIDITDRLLQEAKITKDGFHVDKAELPSGNHRLLLKIKDSAERTGEREVKITIQ